MMVHLSKHTHTAGHQERWRYSLQPVSIRYHHHQAREGTAGHFDDQTVSSALHTGYLVCVYMHAHTAVCRTAREGLRISPLLFIAVYLWASAMLVCLCRGRLVSRPAHILLRAYYVLCDHIHNSTRLRNNALTVE